jgi:hypothetical protein
VLAPAQGYPTEPDAIEETETEVVVEGELRALVSREGAVASRASVPRSLSDLRAGNDSRRASLHGEQKPEQYSANLGQLTARATR